MSVPFVLTRIALSLVVLLPVSAPAAGAEAGTVEVVGVAPVFGGDILGARARALDDARLRAVEQVRGVELEGRTVIADELLVDSSVSSHTLGWVSAVKILEEGEGGKGLYKVRARITVEAPTAAPLAPGQKVTVQMEGASPVAEDVRAAVAARLTEAGVHPMAGAKRTLRLRIEHSVQETIQKGFYACRLSIAMLLDGRSVGTSAHGRGFGKTQSEALSEAASAVARRAVGSLLSKSATGFERKVRITIDGIADLHAYRRLNARLAALTWVTALEPDGVGLLGGRAVWIVRAHQPGGALAVRLDTERDLEVVSFDPEHIHVQVQHPRAPPCGRRAELAKPASTPRALRSR